MNREPSAKRKTVELNLDGISNMDAYIRKTIATAFPPGLTKDEVDELVADGLEIVAQVVATLNPGESAAPKVRRVLRSRLVDAWRQRHPEHRRNTRAGTVHHIVATGLSHEHFRTNSEGEVETPDPPQELWGMPDQERIVEAKLAYQAITRPEDLGNPKLVGRLFGGVPSHRVVPTGKREDVFDAIERERMFKL
jgi:hypothetical protein